MFLPSTRPGHLPNLLVIGAQKCGTTSLHYYLGLHPQISMSRMKEITFFSDERKWRRGLDWYRSHFRVQAPVRGESSPAYSIYPTYPHVAARVHAVIPDVRLIYLVRDPIARILSHYRHLYAYGQEHRPLAQMLQQDGADNMCVWRSRYHLQIQQYLPYFPLQRILIVAAEDLMVQRQQTLARIFAFLEVDQTFTSSRFVALKHRSSEKRRLNRLGRQLTRLSEGHLNPWSPGLQRYLVRLLCRPLSQPIAPSMLAGDQMDSLRELLRPDVEGLRSLTGQSFSAWSV